MTGIRPLTELNTKPLTKALTVLKAFKDQRTLAQSTNTPITILAATVSKFSTRTPSINPTLFTQASVPVSTSVLLDNTQIQCRNVKLDPSTPDEGAKAAAVQRQKKPRRNDTTNATKQQNVALFNWKKIVGACSGRDELGGQHNDLEEIAGICSGSDKL
jgi:hypothetical protein